MRFAFGFVTITTFVALSACDTGPGSRVAPFFGDRPSNRIVGAVLNERSEAIVSARVAISGFPSVATDSYGRFEIPESVRGMRRITIDARAASADGSDRYGTASYARTLPLGGEVVEIPKPFVLPDLDKAAATTLTIGSQASASTVDGRVGGVGPRLLIDAGSEVGRASQASGTFSLELATIPGRDLPAPLPDPATGTWLTTRAAWVLPEDVSFTQTTARLETTNEVALPPSGTARIFRYDFDLETWTSIEDATPSGGFLVPASKFLTRGGLYVFAVEVAATTVSGVLTDLAKRPLSEVYVDAYGRHTMTDTAGRFTLSGMPAVDAAGAAWTIPLRLRPGYRWTPSTRIQNVVAALGTTDAGTTALPVFVAGSARYLVAFRGNAQPLRSVRIGSGSAGGTVELADLAGFGEVTGLSAGWCGASTSWSIGPRFFRGESLGEIRPGTDGVDLQILSREEELRPGELQGAFFARVIDQRTGAPVPEAFVQGRHDANSADRQRSNLFGEANLSGDRFGIVTASLESYRADGRAYRAAFSVGKIDNIRVEFPLRRNTRATPIVLEPHASLVGSLVGARSGSVRRVQVHGALNENDWFSLAMGAEVGGEARLPRALDPAVTGGDAYRLGIPVKRASVAIVEGSLVATRFVPERLALLPDLRAAAGTENRVDLAFGTAFDRTALIRGLVPSLDPSIATSTFEYRLGAVLADGRRLDLTPWCGGAVVQASDFRVLAPADVGEIRGARLLFAARASATTGGATRTQELFGEDLLADGAYEFMPVPVLANPTPGSTLASAEEIRVEWAASTSVDFYELDLEATGPRAEDRHWRVVLRGDASEFRFRDLVEGAPEIVGPGVDWKLSLVAHRISRGPAFGRTDAYQRVAGNAFSFRDGHRGVGLRSAVTIEFSTP